jgi:hypothetical protein
LPEDWVVSELVALTGVAGTQLTCTRHCAKDRAANLISLESQILLEILRQRLAIWHSAWPEKSYPITAWGTIWLVISLLRNKLVNHFYDPIRTNQLLNEAMIERWARTQLTWPYRSLYRGEQSRKLPRRRKNRINIKFDSCFRQFKGFWFSAPSCLILGARYD